MNIRQEGIGERWNTIFNHLLVYYFITTVSIIFLLSSIFLLLFNIRFVFFAIPLFYLIMCMARLCLFFHTDYALSKQIGYYHTQQHLWEHWNAYPHSKRFKIFRTPYYDCRIGQLKYFYNRGKNKNENM